MAVATTNTNTSLGDAFRNPDTGALNYDTISQAIRDAANRTRNVVGGNAQINVPQDFTRMLQAGATPALTMYQQLRQSFPTSTLFNWDAERAIREGNIPPDANNQRYMAAQTQLQGALQGFETQRQATQQQAGQAATALELQGASTVTSLANLDALQGRFRGEIQSSLDKWNEAVEQADEYVTASKLRASAALEKLDAIQKQIGTDRDFAKAHDMQAATQAALGAMRGEERKIAEMYGVSSAEYQSFRQSRQNTMATIQSNIQANYSKLREEQQTAYLGAVNTATQQSNMYIGYNEQNHIQTMQLAAENAAAYALQMNQFDLGIEQLRSAGLENLANWLVETPVFALDTGPVVAAIADIMNTTANLPSPSIYQYQQASRNMPQNRSAIVGAA